MIILVTLMIKSKATTAQHELCKKPNKKLTFLWFSGTIIWLIQTVVFNHCKYLF